MSIPGSTHESESPHTIAARIGREQAGWESTNELEDEHKELGLAGECAGRAPSFIPDVPPEYHQEFNPQHLAPEDEVGTFNIGSSPLYEHVDMTDKGPGFEARLKNMEGKAPMSLLSPIFIEGICAALTHGTGKYAKNMWRDDPMSFCDELDSIFRHLFAFLRCEDYDAAPPSGSGLLHLFNAGCRLMFLTERYFTHPELDDRYPAPGLDDFEEGAEAQYDEEHLDECSRSELYDIIYNLTHTEEE